MDRESWSSSYRESGCSHFGNILRTNAASAPTEPYFVENILESELCTNYLHYGSRLSGNDSPLAHRRHVIESRRGNDDPMHRQTCCLSTAVDSERPSSPSRGDSSTKDAVASVSFSGLIRKHDVENPVFSSVSNRQARHRHGFCSRYECHENRYDTVLYSRW